MAISREEFRDELRKSLGEPLRNGIRAAARTICDNFSEWEAEAGQLSQVEQNQEAGDEHLYQKVVTTIAEAISKELE